jgi:hypothetical protein
MDDGSIQGNNIILNTKYIVQGLFFFYLGKTFLQPRRPGPKPMMPGRLLISGPINPAILKDLDDGLGMV